jgi:hypothetical protein
MAEMSPGFGQKLGRIKNKFFSGIIYLLGILMLLAGLALVGFQIFLFLYQGAWSSFSLLRFIDITPIQFQAWVVRPDQWLGLHKIVYWLLDVPLAFLALVCGFLLIKLSDLLALFSD